MPFLNHEQECLKTVRQTLISNDMIQPGNRVVLAVSGGPDSVALTHIMVRLSADFSFTAVVAHLDHMIRRESNEDFKFVEDLAKSLGLEFFGQQIDIPKMAKQRKISIEEAGRIERYKFFEEVIDANGAQKIATGHNSDDSLETFLLRIFQGSSITGLSGIPLKRGRIIRPLLKLGRAELVRFLEDQRIRYKIDITNLSCDTDRNFTRNRIIPIVLERFPKSPQSILRTLDLIQKDEQYLSSLVDASYEKAVSETEDCFKINMAEICTLPEAVSSRIVRKVLFALSGPNTRWTRFHIDRILLFIKGSKPYVRFTLPYGLYFTRDYSSLKISRLEDAPKPDYSLIVSGPGLVTIPESKMDLEFSILREPSLDLSCKNDSITEYFDADLLTFPFHLRPFQSGDRIVPWGQSSPVKIKKLFIDSKIPHSLRNRLPMIIKADEIIWAAGLRRCASYGSGPQTKQLLKISMIFHKTDSETCPCRK